MIAIEQLAFHYPAQPHPALSIASFNLTKGEQVFISGPSGAGKSTLLKVLAGILAPQQGTYHFLDQNIAALRERERDGFRAEHIGYVFQDFNLVPYLTVLENVLLKGAFYPLAHTNKKEALDLLTALNLPEALFHKSVTALSTGQQQRVAMARALLGSPSLIIADEPTSALDDDNETQLIRLLIDTCREKDCTLVVVSHNRALAELFDRQLVLTNGVLNDAL